MTNLRAAFSLPLIAALCQRNDCRSIHTEEPHHSDKSLDLFNKGLNSVPKNLDSDTEYLILSQNQITTLANLEECSKLLYLSVSYNLLTTKDDLRGIRSAKRLQFLDLSYNSLLTFNLNTFQQNKMLQVLILDGNPGLTIDGEIPSLPHLQKLLLKNCSLTSLPWKDFRLVPRLEILDLRGNSIKEFSEDAIRSLPDFIELMIDPELCSVLENRVDVKEKQVKLHCTITSSDSEEIPEDAVTENKSLDGGGSDKIEKDYLIWFIWAFIGIVFYVATVAILMGKMKKEKRSFTAYEEDNEVSLVDDQRWIREQHHETEASLAVDAFKVHDAASCDGSHYFGGRWARNLRISEI